MSSFKTFKYLAEYLLTFQNTRILNSLLWLALYLFWMEDDSKTEKEHKIHVGQGRDMGGETKKSLDTSPASHSLLLVVIVASAAITAGVWYQTHKLGVEVQNLVHTLQNMETGAKQSQQTQQGK